MIDLKRIIGYRIINEFYEEGFSLEPVTVEDYLHWYHGVRSEFHYLGHVEEMILVSNSVAMQFLIAKDLLAIQREKLEKLHKQYKVKE